MPEIGGKFMVASRHLVNRWKPCPICRVPGQWFLQADAVYELRGIGTDLSCPVFVVGCKSCGFVALLSPAIADPKGWAYAQAHAPGPGKPS